MKMVVTLMFLLKIALTVVVSYFLLIFVYALYLVQRLKKSGFNIQAFADELLKIKEESK